MHHRTSRGPKAIAIVVFFIASTAGFAQTPPLRQATLKVQGLTSAMRDVVAQDLRRDGQFFIAFACVPAGILVVEPLSTDRHVDVQRAVLPLIEQRIARSSIRTTTMDRNAAEAQCAEARNR